MGPAVVAAGGALVQVLGSDMRNPKKTVDLDVLKTWIQGSRLTTTTVRDPEALPFQTENALVSYEYGYLVDLRTMIIVQSYIGSSAVPGDTTALRAMRDMLVLLGARPG